MYDDVLPIWPGDGLPVGRPFTAAQALEHGLTRWQIARLHREGVLRRVLHGVYVDAAAEDTLEHRIHALGLVVPSTAVVTEECAAWSWGVDLLAEGDHLIPPPLSVHQPLENTRVRKDGTRGGRRTFRSGDVVDLGPVRVASGLRTACDLARLRSRGRGLAALDALQRATGFDTAEVLSTLPRYVRHRGVVQLRELAPLVDGRAESPAESVMRLLWIDAGLPTPTPQVTVEADRVGHTYRLDLGLPEIRYAAEYDGVAWHTSPEQVEHDRHRRAWLRQHLGWEIDVLGTDEVFRHPERAGTILRAGISRALRRRRPTG